MHSFTAILDIIGINPYVSVPEEILKQIFLQAGKEKSPIPVRGTINGQACQQTLMKFKGAWRLYVNTAILPDSPRRVGELLDVSIEFDPSDRTLELPASLKTALDQHPKAKQKFESLPPSHQKELIRYIANLKKEETIARNVQRTIDFLTGKISLYGRKID